MKTLISQFSLSLFTIALLTGCGGNSEDDNVGDDEKGTRTLTQNSNLKGVIGDVADVDWYTIDMHEPGIVGVKVFNQTFRYDVDILATVYQDGADGQLQRLAADHFPEDSATKSSLNINVNVTNPKKLYIAVRDLDDNDSSMTETYSISYDVAAPEDDNGTFETAATLTPGGDCHTDSIGTVGDTDVMRFNLATSGVFEVTTDFNALSDTSVDLKISLFDDESTLIRSVSKTVDGIYRMVESLAAGNYYLLAHDQGKDAFDTASPYTTCLASVSTQEVSVNDDPETAENLGNGGHYEINGSIDYAEDEDWSIIGSGATPPSIQVFEVEFDPSDSNGCNSWFLLEIKDSNDEILYSKEYSTETGPRTAHVKVESSGEHFVSVSAVDEQVCSLEDSLGMNYDLTINVVNVSDDVEMGETNNTINNAIELDENANEAVEAKLSYVRDVDWYRVTVPANSDQDRVLEIFVETDSPTPLEYLINVFKGDAILDTFTGSPSEQYETTFKTSYLIPKTVGNTDSDYFIKIVDMQSDEADIENTYSVRTNILPINTTAPAAPGGKVTEAQFFSESDEQAELVADNNELQLIVRDSDRRYFSYNSTGFSVTPENLGTLVTADTEADTITVNFPWQSGYVDYAKDRDWYRLNLPEIYTAAGGIAEDWYVEITVELYSPGSAVEYAWGLYRDRSNDAAMNDWRSGDGLYASNGDVSVEVAVLDLVVPAAGAGPMWVNNETAENQFFLTVADILNQSTNIADNDWGYDQAYFVKVGLVYHSNVSRP